MEIRRYFSIPAGVLQRLNHIELLRCFRETRSDEAFTELVRRHVGMVYTVALRRVRNADWADEVAHAVFIALAQKAGVSFGSDRSRGLASSGDVVCGGQTLAR